ncbi:MAG: hypothetical protein R2815_08885 [Flavobacteriales bacterium]
MNDRSTPITKAADTSRDIGNVDAANHVTGRSIYLDDIVIQQGTLYALPYDAPTAHAHIKKLDVSKAASVPACARHSPLTHKDILGENLHRWHHTRRTALRRARDPFLGHAGGTDHRDLRRHRASGRTPSEP